MKTVSLSEQEQLNSLMRQLGHQTNDLSLQKTTSRTPGDDLKELFDINSLTEDDVARRAISIANDLQNPGCRVWLRRFITQDQRMLELKDKLVELVNEPDPVLITGPTGTGKELLAQALHGERAGNIVPINCGGMPEHLIESELFGHKAGSFTGSRGDHNGIFREADHGTVFLDEIGELSYPLQCKLLRAIQESKVRPVGESKEVPISCRFVAATNHNLWELVQQGKFRKDLYARLFVFELQTTALVERKDDIPLIMKHLLGRPMAWEEFSPFYQDLIKEINVRALVAAARRIAVWGSLQ